MPETIEPVTPIVTTNVGGGHSLKQTKVLKRESGLELLRIIAMLLIVVHHVHLWGGISIATTWGQKLSELCGAGGKLGVNIFILISAYFMVNKKFKLTRILNTVLQATFYSLVIYALFTIFGDVEFTFTGFIYALFAVFYNKWWFVTAYLMLMLLSPALNIVLHAVDKKTLGLCLLGMASFTILFPYVSKILTDEIIETPYFTDIFFFSELYFIGGYIKLYGLNLKKRWVALITFVVLCFGLLVTYTGRLGGWREMGWQQGSLTNFVCAVGLLLIFKDFKFQSRVINTIASTTFGIYLIHENIYMRGWEYAFCRETFFAGVTSSALMFLLLTVTVFVFSAVIDFIRLQTIHRATNKFLKFVDQKIADRKVAKINDNNNNA